MTVSSQKTFHASVAVERHCGGLRGQSSGFGSGAVSGQVSGQSSGQSSGQHSGRGSDLKSDHLVNIRLLEARRANPLGHYSLFPDRWRALLRREFLDAREVAGFFKVSEKAAEKWWGGIGGPNGAKLDYALRELPGAHSFYTGRPDIMAGGRIRLIELRAAAMVVPRSAKDTACRIALPARAATLPGGAMSGAAGSFLAAGGLGLALRRHTGGAWRPECKPPSRLGVEGDPEAVTSLLDLRRAVSASGTRAAFSDRGL